MRGGPTAGVPEVDTEQLKRAGQRWLVVAGFSVALFAAVYVLAVLTPAGQRWENAVFAGSFQAGAAEVTDADDNLAVIQVGSLAVAIMLIAIVGVIRRQLYATVAAVGVIVVGVGSAEALKHWVLVRPALAAGLPDAAHNSVPSGHTTIAMTVMVAAFLVCAYRWRGWVTLVVMTWTTAIGAYTVVAHWHRLSDTLGADLIALGLGSVADWWLLRRRRIAIVSEPRGRIGRTIYIIAAAAIGALSLVLGVLLAVASVAQGLESEVAQYNAFLAAQSLAGAASTFTALIYWWTWHRLGVGRNARSSPRA